jgi:hypothetical protein
MRWIPAGSSLGPAPSHGLRDAYSCGSHVVVLPHADHQPAGGLKHPIRVPISRDVRPYLFRHHSALAFGQFPWSGQPCQKHPSTKTAVRAPTNTMSPRRRRPGVSRRSTRYLCPRAYNSRLRANSTGVSRSIACADAQPRLRHVGRCVSCPGWEPMLSPIRIASDPASSPSSARQPSCPPLVITKYRASEDDRRGQRKWSQAGLVCGT